MSIGRDEIVGNGNPFDNVDALSRQCIVFHVAHRDETIDALHAEPMYGVRHELLKAGVLNAGDAFRALEISRRRIAAFLPLAGVVDEKFSDFAERAAFLAVIDNDSQAAALGAACALLYAVDQIGSACTNVRAKNVRAVAFIVNTASDPRLWIGELCDIAKKVNRRAADRRQKDLHVRPRH